MKTANKTNVFEKVMKGYFNNEEATRNTIDTNGWLHTGDVAVYDEEGYCFIVDRLKELIKVKGLQVIMQIEIWTEIANIL